MNQQLSYRRLHFNTWCKQNLWNSPIWQIWNDDESVVKFITKTLWFELFSIEYSQDVQYIFSNLKESFVQKELETYAMENAAEYTPRSPLSFVEEKTLLVWSITERGLQSPSQLFEERTNYGKVIEFFQMGYDSPTKSVMKATLQLIANDKYKVEISYRPVVNGENQIWMIKSQHTLIPQQS